jgi:hypothetical protein
MYIKMTCPNCRRSGLRLRPEHLGHYVQCKHCGESFRSSTEHFIPLNGPSSGTPSSPIPPAYHRGVEVTPPEERRASRLTAGTEVALALKDAQGQIVVLEVRLRGTQGQPGEARGRLRDESSGGSEAQRCHADVVARLEEDLRAVRGMLGESRDDVDRLRAELGAAVSGALQANRRAEAGTGEKDDAAAERARLEREVAGLRSEVEAARRAMAKASRRAKQGARAAAEARVWADEAESAARGLRDQVDRLGSDRRDGQDERAQYALCQDLKDACSGSVSEREGKGTLSEAMIDLEQRFADILNILNDLHANAERAERSEAAARTLRSRNAEPDETLGASEEGEYRLDLVAEVTRRLTEARQSNQRLCSLLGVFGMSKEVASQMIRQAEAPAGLVVDDSCPQTSQA